ncbi:MAG: hypothetical protein HKP58_02010, partial [Desulfatitalea sp.]|nr:hypothetical protein [Desulfatitalea sp.]NNJ99163.1 hypothetical protein [Desulfatitalea sp.]
MALRAAIFVGVVILFSSGQVPALMVMEQNEYYVYYPENESHLAADLLGSCAKIADFLKNHGLPLKTPLHIVLDDSLDQPAVRTKVIPHRQVRIPLKGPGVLEDGANVSNPWHYFLFMGLSAQAIYNERSGIPAAAHTLFGDLISPNVILPEWGIDGIAFLLYELYHQRTVPAPLAQTLFTVVPIPQIDQVSNHPDVWPGRFSHRIFGRPFIRWLYEHHGWEKLSRILDLHGRGIIPIEIEGEAKAVYGKSWPELWHEFRQAHPCVSVTDEGMPIIGYWKDPFIYWNDAGIHPGPRLSHPPGRYGYVAEDGGLRLSAYTTGGISRTITWRNNAMRIQGKEHTWDPGPGGVAVTRIGSTPFLIIEADRAYQLRAATWPQPRATASPAARMIAAPHQATQMSGPVMDKTGRIAVAAAITGNWDIWLYDGRWHRLTDAPGIEMDPWFEEDRLIFSSNASGRFQLHTHTMTQLTHFSTAAILPRGKTFLHLQSQGWQPRQLSKAAQSELASTVPLSEYLQQRKLSAPDLRQDPSAVVEGKPYSPVKSIWPNYIAPDLYIDTNDLQIGLSTSGRDVSGEFAWDTGARYSIKDEVWSFRLGGRARNYNARTTRYPFGYTTSRLDVVSEIRQDVKLGWHPPMAEQLEVSANYRRYHARYDGAPTAEQWWAALQYRRTFGRWYLNGIVDLFEQGSQSIYGDVAYRFGERIRTVTQLSYGNTWGDAIAGHNTFRIGGNAAEGFFTQRPSRLFPLRGFDANLLDATQAATLNI